MLIMKFVKVTKFLFRTFSKNHQCSLCAKKNTKVLKCYREACKPKTPPSGMFIPKRMSIIQSSLPGLITYGLAAFLAIVYITEFKTLLQYLPYYNLVYKMNEPEKKKEPHPPPPPPEEKPEPVAEKC